MKRVFPVIRNKYFLISIAFVVWVAFFDRNDIFSHYEAHQKLSKLLRDRQYFEDQIIANRNDYLQLSTNPENLEKFAREKYLMKKDNEDIFIFVKE